MSLWSCVDMSKSTFKLESGTVCWNVSRNSWLYLRTMVAFVSPGSVGEKNIKTVILCFHITCGLIVKPNSLCWNVCNQRLVLSRSIWIIVMSFWGIWILIYNYTERLVLIEHMTCHSCHKDCVAVSTSMTYVWLITTNCYIWIFNITPVIYMTCRNITIFQIICPFSCKKKILIYWVRGK